MTMRTVNSERPISQFLEKYFLHFNAASVVDAARAYEKKLADGSKMLVSLAGAMSTAELGKIFAEMIRQDKVHIISCTGANLEEDIMNLVAHSHQGIGRFVSIQCQVPVAQRLFLGAHFLQD